MLNEGIIKKVKAIQEQFEKYYIIVIGCLWTLSTLWDLITFHCYFGDYILEFISCFFIIFMVLYLMMPAKVPKIIINNFGVITLHLGRGIIMLAFSLLFLGDKHIFHKLSAIFLFIGGFLLTAIELLSPTSKGEAKKFYPEDGNQREVEVKNSQNDSTQDNKNNDSQPEVLDKNPNDPKLSPSMEPETKNNSDF